MSASANKPQSTCRNCGALLRGGEGSGRHCVSCLLELACDEDGDTRAGNERFDHYQVATHPDGTPVELGRGAMGVTYRAFDMVLRLDVALKVIDASIAAHPIARERFLREARSAARLRHPNIVSIFYYGVRKKDNQCFYAMELVEGETLEARLRREGPQSPLFALQVVTQVARALVAAEAQGVVHRDIKPANLMLVEGAESTVKIIDFGLAKATAIAEGAVRLTHGAFVGTPAFASPEQFTGNYIDSRSDLYSLGVVLWEMLTGQTPFQGSPPEIMYQHQHASPPLEQLKGFPQPVVALLEIFLDKEPGRRFQNPAELLNAIPSITDAIEAARRITPKSLRKPVSTASRAGTRKSAVRVGPKKVSVARLPITGRDMFGREEDLAFLDDAWTNRQVNVVTIVAWAGVGKSTLVNHWLRRMATDRYRSAELIFGWSFYQQGSRVDTSSADEFLDAALIWFGDLDPRLGTAWEKGERLAKLVSRRRTLLVLDGLEPLQNPPGPQEGRLREPSLQALLRELAAFNTGLCVITTRIPIDDLADHERTSALRRDLEQISSEAGAKLLRALGVDGYEEELRSASDAFAGHCLALTLLGSYLKDACNGNISARKQVSKLLSHEGRQGSHPRKVMESYETWFGEGPELSVLLILGFFDRPVGENVLSVLLNSPAIPGLTESLTDLSPTEWRIIVGRLRRARLLAEEDPHNPGQLDSHPLVREYFGERLRSRRVAAWKESNRRLYDYYRTLAPHLPDSFREMEPLFLAVICACNAGLFYEALHEVYIARIQRGSAYFAANILGAGGTLLSILVHFFEHRRWSSPMETSVEGQSLTAEDQLFILMQAELYLTAERGEGNPEARIFYERAEQLCHSLNHPRFSFAVMMGQWRYSLHTEMLTATMQIAERIYSSARDQRDAALMIGASRAMAVTLLYLGDFKCAKEGALQGVKIWRSGNVRPSTDESPSAVACLCYLALSEWHLGEIATCRATMAEAVSIAKELKDINSFASTLTWAVALGQWEGDISEVDRMASDLIELSTRHNFLHWLAIGAIHRGWARSASGGTADGIPWIEKGIRDFRTTGSMLGLPYFLGLKAEALFLAGLGAEALEAIKEAETIIERSEQRQWCAELHRLRGVFLTTMGAEKVRIEASFRSAIEIAIEQNSISLMKRAEISRTKFRNRLGNQTLGAGI